MSKASNSVVIAVCLVAIGVSTYRIVEQWQERERRLRFRYGSTTMSNVRQLTTAMLVYARDNDDRLPPVTSVRELKGLLAPILKNKKVWETENPKSEWVFNSGLSGLALNSVSKPGSVLMFYESQEDAQGKRYACFMDGAARAFRPGEVSRYLEVTVLESSPLPRK